MAEINKVVVIGAGVMGAGIAAHVANAGLPVALLDIVPSDAKSRSALAEGAIERMLKAEPAPFMSKAAAKLVTPGNIEDHFAVVGDADWIVEAVTERLDVKQALYARIEATRKDGSVVSSNTSTLPLAKLTEGLPPRFAADFLITHFFNPPRYMRLLEVVAGPQTKPAAVDDVVRFADLRLGKSVVRCKDRPGFIANRLGVYWLQAAVVEAFDRGLAVEDVDAIIGKPMGIPKTGVFGLLDLVGLDLMPHVNASLAAALPKDDPFHGYNRPLPVVEKLIATGYTGRKGKGGFYRINREAGKRKEALDLLSGEYRLARKADVAAIADGGRSLNKLITHDSAHGAYAWRVLSATLAYAASLVGDAADDIESIDEAMRLGYNWKFGPFELIDRLGAGWFSDRLKAEGRAVPDALARAVGHGFYRVENGRRQALGQDGLYHDIVRPAGVLLLEDIKLNSQPVLNNGSAALWDIGDGVACFEFTSKMNSLDADVMEMLAKSIRRVKKDFKALVIYNEGSNFSVGANLGLALFAGNIAAWSEIESLVSAGQDTYRAMKYAPFPVVGAPSGMALGGGCEILLHCDAVQAHAETYMGLVEVGVGLVPAWGGCKEMLHRWQANPKLPKGPMPAIAKVFETVSVATVAKSAADAKELLYLRPGDGITMNRNRLLADAKARALAMVENYKPPEPPTFALPGPAARVAMDMAVAGFRRLGKATPYDEVVSGALAEVLSGGDTDILKTLDEDALLELERTSFMRLVRQPGTLARVESMLLTGKPLRN
ncbi:3-hydroxyacyl-CoA dehydrogenase/enoyl-CoA hydratase family protein [Blastochloris viridis]|uniref:Enoyl-CoA hydratase [isoleucine degradation] n=1 Tax=Blastochloris viridis TaxID=1079 RepID=A0A0H5BGA6_BLAVI|nr:3-hydroxyacyl-CoA dehydrogenase/enoyl-CoA hydratase family protein [Blastochloris viridis]ALK09925.1 putative 3-hydroxyacyl-CoA dehydrogenase [Blastochloris viridis]BAS00165.1 enoyl-CoA hydratase [isoleucine degradation] [Blastochloris viridis]CUU42588.1 putative 3-hydroxyacyl-CoA dehydrogenase [Blastochloris viridis]